jgi:predicted acyl esterase
VIRFSPWTGWEAPDPAVWTAQGYAVVNADLRGAGTPEGHCDLFSDQEAEDYHDLIEWVGTQPWSSGRVGRELDAVLSTPLQPIHTHRTPEPLTPGRPTLVDVALLPHATRLRAGEQLIVELRGTWPFPRDPWRGQFTTGYQRSKKATCTVHTGGCDGGLPPLRCGQRPVGSRALRC